MDKKELRQYIRQRKRTMTEREIGEKSEKLCRMLVRCDAFLRARTVYGYLPYNQEVRILPALKEALRQGKRVAVPKVYGEEMRFLYLDDLTRVEKGYAGIPEPVADEPVAEDKTALVLVPGLAFDQKGNRMGYGGGFYDRFLRREPTHPTIALCYDFQMVEAIPTQDHDIPVNTVLWI